MQSKYCYACRDYPEMEACPFEAVAETENELWRLIELHASVAHGEDPSEWSDQDRGYLKTLIRSESQGS